MILGVQSRDVQHAVTEALHEEVLRLGHAALERYLLGVLWSHTGADGIEHSHTLLSTVESRVFENNALFV